MIFRRALLIGCAAVVLAACGGSPGQSVEGQTIDGWAIGPAVSSCGTPLDGNGDWCQELLEAAATDLDRRDPGHAGVVQTSLYTLGAMSARTFQPYVAVFSLADGGRKAIGVGWPLTAHGVPVTIDYGP